MKLIRAALAFILLAFYAVTSTAALTPAQLVTLKAAILAETDPAFVLLRTAGETGQMAEWFNQPSTTWVWRTEVSRADVYNSTSVGGTTWNWTTYKSQAATEQGAWTQMFMGDRADFSQANLRAGVSAIFGAANAQTTHILAVAKRLATRGEKVFAVGTGTKAVPSTMAFEGMVSNGDILSALTPAQAVQAAKP